MNRDEWFRDRARRTVGALPSKARAMLGSCAGPERHCEIGQAVLVARIWELFVSSASSDSIARHLRRSGFFDDSVAEATLLENLVLPVRHQFCSGTLPFPNRWEPHIIYLDLLVYYLQDRRRQGSDDETLERELRMRWKPGDGIVDELWETIRCRVRPISLDLLDELEHDPLTDMIRELAGRRDVQTVVAKVLSKHPPELHELDDISAMVRFFRTMEAVQYVAGTTRGLPGSDIIARSKEIRRSAAESVRGLSSWETGLLGVLEDEESVIRRYVAACPEILHVDDGGGVNALPDHVHGKAEMPPWVAELVFVRGARSAHSVKGIVPHFVCVQEAGDAFDIKGLGMMPLERDGTRYTISLVLSSQDSSPVVARYRYDLQANDDLHELAWLALAGWFRIDVVRIAPVVEGTALYGRLEIRLSELAPMPRDQRDEIRRVVVEVLRARFGDDPRALEEGARVIRDEGGPRFLHSDLAKSERLAIELTEDHQSLEEAVDPDLLDQLSEAKVALLRHHADRAAQFVTGRRDLTAFDERLRSLQARLVHVRQLVRGQAPELFSVQPDRIAAALGSEDRCFVHLRRDSEYLAASWCRPAGNGLDFGEIDLSRTSAKRINALTIEWLNATGRLAQEAALERLLEAVGEGIATPIWAALGPRGVKRLVLSPSSDLDIVPFHCAPVDTHGGRSCFYEALEELSYAPSARVLAQLHDRGPIALGACLAIAYDTGNPPIPQVYEEAHDLASLFAGWNILTGDAATPEHSLAEASRHTAVHFACHGEACLEDFYCSGLHLAGAARHKGYLSAALILAEGDFRDVGLVTLSACRTGVSGSPPVSLHDAGGLDAAFLARGARCAVSTLWPVYDDVARAFMKAFYLHLSRGLSVVEACRRTVDLLRNIGERNQASVPATSRDIAAQLSDDCDQYRSDLRQPLLWGAFRCTGWTWWHPVTVPQ